MTLPIDKQSYYLSRHTFFCLADNHYVFLDLRNDEYLCLGRSHTDAIRGLLNGHQVANECSVDTQLRDTRDSNLGNVIRALLQKNLLVQNVGEGKLATPALVDAPLQSLLETSDRPRPRIGPVHVCNFFATSAAASWNLRYQSIEHTVRTIKDIKPAHRTAVDREIVADLFRIFQTLRPYYPRPYLCMFDSLALLYFLGHFGVFPQWVYGVKVEPFAAHCWVQTEDLVVNDIIDNVRDYTAIMSV